MKNWELPNAYRTCASQYPALFTQAEHTVSYMGTERNYQNLSVCIKAQQQFRVIEIAEFRVHSVLFFCKVDCF